MSVTKMVKEPPSLARQSPTKVLELRHAPLGLVQAPLPGSILVFRLEDEDEERGRGTLCSGAAADRIPKAKAVTRALASRFPAGAEFLQLHLQLSGFFNVDRRWGGA